MMVTPDHMNKCHHGSFVSDSSLHGAEVVSLSAYRLTFPVDDQRLHQRVELPEMLVRGLHLLQLLLKPLQQKKKHGDGQVTL